MVDVPASPSVAPDAESLACHCSSCSTRLHWRDVRNYTFHLRETLWWESGTEFNKKHASLYTTVWLDF